MGWWNEPLKKWDFKFRRKSSYSLQLPSWAHNWNRQRMNFQKMSAKKDVCSQLFPQSSPDYPPPIWSLSSTNLIIGLHLICWISFHISHHICSKCQCSEPQYHVLQYIWFRFLHALLLRSELSQFGFSTHFPLVVNRPIWHHPEEIKFCALQSHLYQHDVHHNWLVIYFIEKHNFCCFWISSILKREGRICRLRGWTMVRGVELIPLYS